MRLRPIYAERAVTEYYAHTYGEDRLQWQPLRDHLINVAMQARTFATDARPGDSAFADAAYAAGLLHDLGKYRPEFQSMIRGTRAKGESTRHKQAGAAYAVQSQSKHFDISFAILGHHGGIPDRADFGESVSAGNAVAAAVFPTALQDCPELSAALPAAAVAKSGLDFDIRTRLLFSCLVDADWLDTSAFHARKKGWPPAPPPPCLNPCTLLPNVRGYIEDRARGCRNPGVAAIRAEVLAAALTAAAGSRGVLTMTVPTGGGKTLSSLAFALEHAKAHNLRRIIYVAPYLSIIEQNARVFRDALGDSAADLILEHHSLAEPGDRGGHGASDANGAESEAAQRLAENWDMPVVLTTTVQFYESLFSNQPSRCRKLHNIARSVIILDECQTLPPGLISPTCEMLEQAASYLGCSIVLCTATQPAWGKDHQRMPSGFSNLREIAPNPPELFRRLKRVEITWPRDSEAALSWQEAAEAMSRHAQVLCVVNTRRAASDVYKALKAMGSTAIHLSTNMCPAHRLRVLDEIAAGLKDGRECRVISTQLVEAGVDLDFPAVMREMAPLESIVQAAGRCNREGLLQAPNGRGQVVVFRSRDGGMPKSGWYRNGAAVVEQDFLRAHRKPRIDHPDDLAEYYRRLYPTGDLDSEKIGQNRQQCNFQTVGNAYRIIDNLTTPIVITTWASARREVGDLLNELRQRPSRSAYRRLQMFTINAYGYELQQMAGTVLMDDPPGINTCCLPYDDAVGLAIGNAATVEVF